MSGNQTLRHRIGRTLPGLRVLYDEPMSRHTSFEIGGPADALLVPQTIAELAACLAFCRSERLPWLLLGGGTNLLVADRGVRGVVILLTALADLTVDGCQMRVQAGAEVGAVAEAAADHGLAGLEFLYGMPGTIGGAAWMNARCYGGEVGERLVAARLLDASGEIVTLACTPADFSYKRSPFQEMTGCIVELELQLEPGNTALIRERMQANFEDRRAKGHFRAPSAGSLFKNDRAFGAPTGKILDELGLRGTISGGAAIAPYHGNIFINQGGATAADVFSLIIMAIRAAHQARSILLEPEVRFVGDWDPEELAKLRVA